MQSAASAAASVELPGERGSTTSAQRLADVDLATAAWLSALPCALVTIVLVVLLGPVLGDLIAGDPASFVPVPDYAVRFHPEPTEHARYLLALTGPLLFVAALALAPRWLPRVPARVAHVGVPATQALLLAVAAVCLAVQYGAERITGEGVERQRHFLIPTLIAACVLAAAVVFVVRRYRTETAALLQDTRARKIGAALGAVLLTVVWLLHAVNSDLTIAMAEREVLWHAGFTLDEAFAVLNGRTPLVDFTAQYGSLSLYGVALPMLVFGESMLTYSLVMTATTALALLAIYSILHRVTRSAIGALLLYLPFLATSMFRLDGTSANRETVGTYFSTFPTRYAGAFLLAWLTARRIDRGGGGFAGLWLMFAAGGLVAVNNQDFGLAALGATIVALLCGAAEVSRALLKRLALALAAGIGTALVLVATLTLVRAGSLPQLDRALDYARLFGVGGFGMQPIPEVIGFHLVVYATYVAALVLAAIRVIRRASDRLLTGMLAWSGVFGLGSAAYYVGRSNAETLVWSFSGWALALALLTVVAVRQLAAHPERRPAIATVGVLIGFGIAACSFAQTPLPWTQIERLSASFTPVNERAPRPDPLVPPADPATRAFVASLADGRSRFVVKEGAPVAILTTNGHRVADAYGVVNVSPYTGLYSLPTIERVQAVVDALREAGGNTIVLPNPLPVTFIDVLTGEGFEIVTDDGIEPYVAGETRPTNMPWSDDGSVLKMVDARNLHPRALQ